MSDERILIVGLDGASPGALRQWAGEGAMPFLGRALDEGASGVLRSSIPPYTPTAWTSIVTGVNPGRHGVFSFTRRTPDGREVLVDSGVCRSKPLWELLAEAGTPSVVVNVPITYPPRPFDGVLVSGMGTPPDAERFTFPDSIRETVGSVAPGYVPDVPVTDVARSSPNAALKALGSIRRATTDRLRLMEALLADRPWRFGMMVLEGPDRIQHLFWKAIEPGAPDSPLRERVLEAYSEMDAGIQRLVGAATAHAPTTVLFVSDHGFQSLEWLCSLNNHLRARGFLRLEAVGASMRVARAAPVWARRAAARLLAGSRSRSSWSSDPVDRDRSIAFAGTVFEQAVHVRPTGGASEDEGRRAAVRAALRELPGPDGGLAVREVLSRDEIYEGPFVNEAPDLFPIFGIRGVMIVPRLSTSKLWEPVREPHGTHHEDGTFIAIGPGVGRRANVAARTEDIAPTVLRLLGLPIPFGMDGWPIEGVGSGPVEESSLSLAREEAAAEPLTTAEEEEIVDHLRGLGYFE